MEENHCKDSAYFHQHYALNQKRIFRVCGGHCTQPKVRKRLPDALACERFVTAESDETAFATKEYLSKELLQYLLHLELLPTIEDL